MMGILAVEACLIYRPTLRALAHSQKALRLAAITDALTGCLNRRWFMEQANIEFTRATQFKTSLTMILIDIDHFKQVNDNYGHPAGDMVLVELVAAILRLVRETDRLARIGGEEFAILLPNTDQETGLQLAQRLLLAISTQRLNVANTTMQITVSIGVATFDPLDVTFDSLLNRTDTHLYEAKHTGRNRVCHKVLAANAALLPSLSGQSA
jgi:diguanylate cyclase (GGDEF)-like protein